MKSKSHFTNIKGDIQFIHGQDITPTAAMITDCINQVKGEIFRLSQLKAITIEDRHKFWYLEELLAAYERDLKIYV